MSARSRQGKERLTFGVPVEQLVLKSLSQQAAARLRGMSCLPPCAVLTLMGLLFARTMAWTSSGKTHPELVNNLYSEYRRGLLFRARPNAAGRICWHFSVRVFSVVRRYVVRLFILKCWS